MQGVILRGKRRYMRQAQEAVADAFVFLFSELG